MNREKALNLLLNAKKIAIVRTDRLGDMILTLPMFNVMREVNPIAELNLIARSYTEPLFRGITQIDKYFLADTIIEYKHIIKENNFDVMLFPMMKYDEVLPALMNNVKLRIGSGYRLYSFLLNFKVYHHRKEGKKNEAEYNLDLLSDITGVNYKPKLISPIVFENIPKDIANYINNEKYIIIHPGGAGSAPRWSPDNFGKLAKMIFDKFKYKIIITGSISEKLDCEQVMKYCSTDFLNVSGRLNLDEMIALISKCEIIISNSTGILHVGAAFERKILGFYPNSPEMSPKRWGPINEKKVLLTPNTKNISEIDNLSNITIEVAFEAFVKLLNMK